MKIIIIIAKPVYFDNSYKGTLAIRLLVNDFRNAYVSPFISSGNESSFIIDNHGVLLAGQSSLLNQNLFTYAQKEKWNQYKDFTQKLHTALKNNTTQTTWTFQNLNEKPVVSLVGISKIDIPDTDKDLFIVVTTPRDKNIAPLRPVKGYGLAWLGFGVFATITGSILILLLQSF